MKNLNEELERLRLQSSLDNKLHKPSFYRISDTNDRNTFQEVLKIPGLIMSDFILDQLTEFVKYKQPSRKFNSEELQLEIKKVLGKHSPDEFGVWVYYPWSNRLVHMLDREDFIALRTSRNHYKITPEERDELMTKKIGVIGLSVGQSVALTLALERVCGEIRLADFDVLELTNLNRIRTGVHNMGLAKVVAVAREIAEIDPFLDVICFPEGIHEGNMDRFFCEGGKLNLLIEESDGFDIKILSRYKARELKVPVLMEASDRCVVDVERFDLEPERSILHGLVDHLDVNTLKNLKTNEQKIPYLLDMVGLNTASLRLKASMLEIEQSINTWPQLASAVTMGGGITADVARRILLNQFRDSGRYFVDVEELIGDKKSNSALVGEYQEAAIDYLELAKKITPIKVNGQFALSKSQAETLVLTACKAPSGGNSQPWRWVYKNESLLLFNAFKGNDTMLGFNGLPNYVAIGAALENIALKAGEMQLTTRFELFPDQSLKEWVAQLQFFKTKESIAPDVKRINAIDIRLTNRNLGERQKIEKNNLAQLSLAAKEVEGARIEFFDTEEELDSIADLLGEIEKIRLLEDMGHRDFVNEIRWTEEENERKKDGVDLRTLDITNAERVGLQVARDKNIIGLINKWNGGGAFKKLTKKSVDSAGAIGVITMNGDSEEDYVNGGRLVQKVWLDANAMGIAYQPLASSLFIYARLLKGNGEGLSEKGIRQLMHLRPRFEKTFHLDKNRGEIFIFRLCAAPEPAVKSLRKPLEEVFSYL